MHHIQGMSSPLVVNQIPALYQKIQNTLKRAQSELKTLNPPPKLTYPLNMDGWKMKFAFENGSLFRGSKKCLQGHPQHPEIQKPFWKDCHLSLGVLRHSPHFFLGGILTLQCLQVFLLASLFFVRNFLSFFGLKICHQLVYRFVGHRKTLRSVVFPQHRQLFDTQERMPIFPRLALVTVLLMSPRMYRCVFFVLCKDVCEVKEAGMEVSQDVFLKW